MKNQTALQWLIEQVHSDEYTHAFGRTYISIDLIEQAKAMEKQQIIGAFDSADFRVEIPEYGWAQKYGSAEDYYTSTFGQ